MAAPTEPPSYDGEVVLVQKEVRLLDDGHGPLTVDISATVYQAMQLPGRTGLELQWVKRAVWIQVPIENMWVMVEDAQVPLTTVTPAKNL